MDRVDKCSYSKVGKVQIDSETISSVHAMPNSHDSDIKEMSMAEFGKKLVGIHYDQQLGYGYREIYQRDEVRLKLYKKVILMDEVCYRVSHMSHAKFND